jgi:heat shock protein HslJ
MLDARADCNGCFGSYETEGISISIGPMGCTLAFCPPPSFDSQYTRALGSVSAFVRQGDELLLTYAEGVMRFLVD